MSRSFSGEKLVGADAGTIWNATVERRISFPCLEDLIVLGGGRIEHNAHLEAELSLGGLSGTIQGVVTQFEYPRIAVVRLEELPGMGVHSGVMQFGLSEVSEPTGAVATRVSVGLELHGKKYALLAVSGVIGVGIDRGLQDFKRNAEAFAMNSHSLQEAA